MPLAQRIACTLCRTGDDGLVETQAFEPQNLTVVGRHSTDLLCRYLQSRWYCIPTFYRVLNLCGSRAQSRRKPCSICPVAMLNLARNTQRISFWLPVLRWQSDWASPKLDGLASAGSFLLTAVSLSIVRCCHKKTNARNVRAVLQFCKAGKKNSKKCLTKRR